MKLRQSPESSNIALPEDWPNTPGILAYGNTLETLRFPDPQPENANRIYVDFEPGTPPKAMRQDTVHGSVVTYRHMAGIGYIAVREPNSDIWELNPLTEETEVTIEPGTWWAIGANAHGPSNLIVEATFEPRFVGEINQPYDGPWPD
ncbi:MAG TPA: hypothetical protein VHT70_04650 [Candidatus Saccharimonadales bacterium]|jgi:hypothetical protein|nr:hypothetical protein [Candidatus Saccharimonadales bacterium]